MKKSIYEFVLITFIAVGIFTSCDSAAKKEEAAKENVEEAQEELKDAAKDANAEAVQKANAEEWKAFKDETDARISKNESYIAELKVRIKRPGKVLDPLYEKQISDLEQRNQELRVRRDAYEANQTDWGKFKSEYNHDMDGLGAALKDFSVNNKK